VNGDLIEEKTSPWSGTIRAGDRALLSKTTMADLRAAYRSLRVSDLSVWEFGLLISHTF
jgi:hypothetical protein